LGVGGKSPAREERCLTERFAGFEDMKDLLFSFGGEPKHLHPSGKDDVKAFTGIALRKDDVSPGERARQADADNSGKLGLRQSREQGNGGKAFDGLRAVFFRVLCLPVQNFVFVLPISPYLAAPSPLSPDWPAGFQRVRRGEKKMKFLTSVKEIRGRLP
jgi:hypothetical protein